MFAGGTSRLCRRLALSICLALSWGGQALAGTFDRIAAVVDGRVIAWSQIYELAGPHIDEATIQSGGDPVVRRALELEALDALIARDLVALEMNRLGIAVNDQEIDRAIDDIARQNDLSRDALKVEVERSGLPWASYRLEIEISLRDMKFNQQVLRARINVREDDLRQAYKRRIEALDTPARMEVEAVVLTVPDGSSDADRASILATAQSVYERATAGEEFSALAKTFSVEPYASRGGAMGVFRPGELVGTLDTPLMGLEAGQLTPPIETPRAIYVLRLAARVAPDVPAFEEVRTVIEQQVLAQKLEQEREQWLLQARRVASVEVLLESPDSL